MRKILLSFAVAATVLAAPAPLECDLLVYGGTAGGVMTAVAGARQGLNTVLIESRAHLGGMATGGLSRTDVGKREVIGGLALEFYYRVGERYEMRCFLNPVAWFYEPRVGEYEVAAAKDGKSAAGGTTLPAEGVAVKVVLN